MNCPLCNKELALGWWCNDCRFSINYAKEIVRLKECFQPEFPWGVVLLMVGMMLVLGLLIGGGK